MIDNNPLRKCYNKIGKTILRRLFRNQMQDKILVVYSKYDYEGMGVRKRVRRMKGVRFRLGNINFYGYGSLAVITRLSAVAIFNYFVEFMLQLSIFSFIDLFINLRMYS